MSQNLVVSLDHIYVKNDHDGFWTGDGDIYFQYALHGGHAGVTGSTSNHGIGSGDTQVLNYQWEVTVEDFLSLSIGVWDEDTGSDDHLRSDLVTSYSEDQNFGVGQHTHQTTDYDLTYSIFVA